MNSTKISITFLLAKSRINGEGKCSIRCRITYLQQRYEFATGHFIKPIHWFSKLQLAKPPDDDNTILNNNLSLIKNKINQAFLFLQMNGGDFDVNSIYATYKGVSPKKEKGVLETYLEYNKKIEKLIGISIEQVTYDKYVESYNHLKAFIKFKFKSNDIKLKELKGNFLNDYDYYLKTEKGSSRKGLAQSTINKAIQRFRKTLKFAISEGYLGVDPFMMHEAIRVKKRIVFLTESELTNLEKQQFNTERIQNVKEYFVFCCYTGLPFKEMSLLKKTDIYTGFDGKLWIHVDRRKTGREYAVPLLPVAKAIIDKFEDENCEFVFPKISNQKFNEYLKEIAGVVGIQKNLTHHVARKTFASTVLLFNDVPMEIVSELLGHAKMSTTQESYGKVVQKKIGEAMTKLSSKIR
jgi:integrase/recombinase XerD